MKLIDKKGRIFGKINILDLIIIVLVLGLIVLASWKLISKEDSSMSGNDEMVNIQIETSRIMNKGYFDVVEVGDRLTESQDYLDGVVKNIEIHPVEMIKEDQDGNIIRAEDPTVEEAIITIEGKASYSNKTYHFGKQEIRQGKKMFIESDLFRYRVDIVNFKVGS